MKMDGAGKDEAIVLLAAVPDCPTCRARIRRGLNDPSLEGVEFGMPSAEGTPVILRHDSSKHPDADYRLIAQASKWWLMDNGYRVL